MIEQKLKIGDYAAGTCGRIGEIVDFTLCNSYTLRCEIKYAVIKTPEGRYQSPIDQIKLYPKQLKATQLKLEFKKLLSHK